MGEGEKERKREGERGGEKRKYCELLLNMRSNMRDVTYMWKC